MSRPRHIDLVQVGLRIRERRKKKGMTLDDLASRSGLSKGLLSKIENFRAIPSLPVLVQIAEDLNVDLGDLLKGIHPAPSLPYMLYRASRRRTVARDDAVGFSYQAVCAQSGGDRAFECFVLTLKPRARRKMVSTEGDQFIFVLEGKVDFLIGETRVDLARGDALFFDGRIPHVPQNPGKTPSVLLAIYLLKT